MKNSHSTSAVNFAGVLLLILLGPPSFAQMETDSQEAKREKYLWLEKHAMADPTVSNADIHNLVAKGLFSTDHVIVNRTLTALGLHVNRVNSRIYNLGTPVLDRRLKDIPGIYDFLVSEWDRKWAEHDGIMPELLYPTDDPIFESINDPEEAMLLLDEMSWANDQSWTLIPQILSSLFPKDSKVHSILWDALYDPDQKHRLLIALLAGEFDTPEANAYRIEILADNESEWFNARLAAISLGRIRSDKGLKALVSRLERPESKWGVPFLEIFEAIVSHGEKAIPHVGLLRKVADRSQNITIGEEDRSRFNAAMRMLEYIERRHLHPEVE